MDGKGLEIGAPIPLAGARRFASAAAAYVLVVMALHHRAKRVV